MNNISLPLITLIIGALLGFFSSFITSTIQHHRTVTLRQLDEFFNVRKDIVDSVSELTILNIQDSISIEQRTNYRNAISKLFYRHYDLLPLPVLEALVLLEVALGRTGDDLYMIKDGFIVRIEDKDEIVRFIEKCAIFNNAKIYSSMAFNSENPTVRENQKIILHARNVLYTMNNYATVNKLLKITKTLDKSGKNQKKLR